MNPESFIQPFGFLLAVSADWLVVGASANLKVFIGIEPSAALGVRLDCLIDVDTLHEIRNRMTPLHRQTGMERLYKKTLVKGYAPLDIAVHYSGSCIVLEGEWSSLEDEVDAGSLMRSMMTRTASSTTLEGLYRDAARQVRGVTGFSRVMIYRLGPNGGGEVLAESLANGMESSLGLRYPAADILESARAGYLSNALSLIADVKAPSVPLLENATGGAQQALDLSQATTRSAPAARISLLKSLGIGAALSVSIIIDGKLWGFIACYSGAAHLPSGARREAVELFGRLFSLTLENRLIRSQSHADVERAMSYERQELLIAELNHRVRNILTLVRGLISQTDRTHGDVARYVESLHGRIQAIARAHDQITRQNWGPGKLSTLLEGEVSAYVPDRKERCTLLGPAICLQPMAFSTMCLVMHELVTNSAKYGSLSDGGRVVVTLDHELGVGLRMKWQEADGPMVRPPQHRGFGSVIIERVVPFDLQGTAEVRYEAAGLVAEFFIPEVHLASAAPDSSTQIEPSPPRTHADDAPAPDTPLQGCEVLLLEDNMIIALETEDLLRELGAHSVHTASTVAGAQSILKSRRIDWALLDINLGATTSLELAATIRDAGIPFIFASGYGDDISLGDLQQTSMTVIKPFSRNTLGRAFIQCMSGSMPSSSGLSPAPGMRWAGESEKHRSAV